MEQRVMASVATLYAARQLMSLSAFKVYALVASGIALWQFTWVHKVLGNWAHVGLSGTWSYLSFAILHTHLPVQIALAVAVAAGVSLLVDAIRMLARPHPRLLLPQ
jgi:hypothetical protein